MTRIQPSRLAARSSIIRYVLPGTVSNPVPSTHTANPQRLPGVRAIRLELFFDFDFFSTNAMRFKPAEFYQTNITTWGLHQCNPLHLSPVAFAEQSIEPSSLTNGCPARDSLWLLRLGNSIDRSESFVRLPHAATRPLDPGGKGLDPQIRRYKPVGLSSEGPRTTLIQTNLRELAPKLAP